MADLALIAKAAAAVLTDEKTRKAAGWVLAAVLSPLILLLACLCALASGASAQNVSAVSLCFHDGTIPADAPAEYRERILEMREAFAQLDGAIGEIDGMIEGDGLDAVRVKAVFYALYFGADIPGDVRAFADCFVRYEQRERTVRTVGIDGSVAEHQEAYTAAVPVTDMDQILRDVRSAMGVELPDGLEANADGIYGLVRYGVPDGGGTVGPPYIGADGACSPVGADWRERVTSEFGYRRDPFTGAWKGHGGIDLAVPLGTGIRAALPGKVAAAAYDWDGYGWYIMLEHEGGLVTLYGHCSQLLAQEGQTIETGDVIARSGSTGRSTGPHLHFEVRVDGTRTDPRDYLP